MESSGMNGFTDGCIQLGSPQPMRDYLNPDAAGVYPKGELGIAGGEPSSNLSQTEAENFRNGKFKKSPCPTACYCTRS